MWSTWGNNLRQGRRIGVMRKHAGAIDGIVYYVYDWSADCQH
jgi:hypothetical protein